ncbi:SusD family protein [Pedobacter nyackensis]|uniref:SusD family protein n=2 Tax=Pedobacter nyackensis TaxID=475255 RepID=A0A1W2B6F9_9SPHI|nr:SusD family protein [Pedobacter nyackensis]
MLSSCGKQLDLFPHSGISPDAVTADDLPALRLGMYNNMQNDPKVHSFITFDILGGNLTGSSGNPLDIINSTLSPLNSIVAASWNGYFSALFQVNNIISICESLPASEVRNRTLGEAYYFRGLIYFNLVTRWGDVPILRKNTLEKPFRKPVTEVWAFVEENLNQAAALLGTSESYYYVSADAVTALRARVMLSQGKMTEATTYAESLITSGKYKLDAFEKIFRKLGNTEVIFAFENISEESSINISDLFYTYAHPNKGQGTYKPARDVVDSYAANDNRKNISIVNIAGTECINKYPSGQTGRDPVIISRIAEMYLISAEAQGRLNGIGRLNQLRSFRGLVNLTVSNDDSYIDAILLERKRELLAENFMYHDLIRLGKAIKNLGILSHQTLLPIPGRELQLNGNLIPNPGY